MLVSRSFIVTYTKVKTRILLHFWKDYYTQDTNSPNCQYWLFLDYTVVIFIFILSCIYHERKFIKANEMTQWVKSLATKPDDLSSISRTHRLSCDLFHTSLHTYAHTHTHRWIKMSSYMLRSYESWVIELGALVLVTGERDWVHTHVWETAMEWQNSTAMQWREFARTTEEGFCPHFRRPFVSHSLWLWAAQLTGNMNGTRGSGLHLTARPLG